jgi:putative phosphoribosyl transferase
MKQIPRLAAIFDCLVEEQRREMERREPAYRGDRGPHDLEDKTVVLVADGLATGCTMVAAVRTVRAADAATQ